jgi:hypothetical protein
MTPATDADHCPHWCARDHSTERRGRAFYHASKTCSVTISTAGLPGFPERADVETAQYIPDDPGEAPWTPTVELTLHAGSRYRVIGLTPEEARQLAAMLARAADLTGGAGAVTGRAIGLRTEITGLAPTPSS